jgi:hypothetical protein
LKSRVSIIPILILVTGVFIGLVSSPLFNSLRNNYAIYDNYHVAAATATAAAMAKSKSGSVDDNSVSSSSGDSGKKSNHPPLDKKTALSSSGNDGKPHKKGDSTLSSSSTHSSTSSPPPTTATTTPDNSNPSTTTTTTIDSKKDTNNKDTTAGSSGSGDTTTASICPYGSKPDADGKCETKTMQPHLQPQQQTQPNPDDDCLFNPSLSKCKSIDEQCPKGFFLNDDDNCVPDMLCPKGFEHHEEDETGTCYPVKVKVDCKNSSNDPICLPSPISIPSKSSVLFKQGYVNGALDARLVQSRSPASTTMSPEDVDCDSSIDPQASNQDYCSGYQDGFAYTINALINK